MTPEVRELLITMFREALEDEAFGSDFARQPMTIRIDMAFRIGLSIGGEELPELVARVLIALAKMTDGEVMEIYTIATTSN